MIRSFTPDNILEFADPLCDLLADAVDSGASVGYLPPLDPFDALGYWDSVRLAIADEAHVLLVAFEGDALIGSVQLDLCQRPNGSHRAEVCKLLVDRRVRRRGLGTALMHAIEEVAAQCGRTLLVLDTRKGDPSEALYRKLGYQQAGEIPEYARSASGELHSTVFYYKKLEP